MEAILKVINNFISARLSDFFNISVESWKEYLEKYIKMILNTLILSTILINFFCISTAFFIYELATQYDKSDSLKLTAALGVSFFIVVLSLGALVYNFKQKSFEFRSKMKIPAPDYSGHQTPLEQALSALIMEFAKDKEFARMQELKKRQQYEEQKTPIYESKNL